MSGSATGSPVVEGVDIDGGLGTEGNVDAQLVKFPIGEGGANRLQVAENQAATSETVQQLNFAESEEGEGGGLFNGLGERLTGAWNGTLSFLGTSKNILANAAKGQFGIPENMSIEEFNAQNKEQKIAMAVTSREAFTGILPELWEELGENFTSFTEFAEFAAIAFVSMTFLPGRIWGSIIGGANIGFKYRSLLDRAENVESQADLDELVDLGAESNKAILGEIISFAVGRAGGAKISDSSKLVRMLFGGAVAQGVRDDFGRQFANFITGGDPSEVSDSSKPRNRRSNRSGRGRSRQNLVASDSTTTSALPSSLEEVSFGLIETGDVDVYGEDKTDIDETIDKMMLAQEQASGGSLNYSDEQKTAIKSELDTILGGGYSNYLEHNPELQDKEHAVVGFIKRQLEIIASASSEDEFDYTASGGDRYDEKLAKAISEFQDTVGNRFYVDREGGVDEYKNLVDGIFGMRTASALLSKGGDSYVALASNYKEVEAGKREEYFQFIEESSTDNGRRDESSSTDSSSDNASTSANGDTGIETNDRSSATDSTGSNVPSSNEAVASSSGGENPDGSVDLAGLLNQVRKGDFSTPATDAAGVTAASVTGIPGIGQLVGQGSGSASSKPNSNNTNAEDAPAVDGGPFLNSLNAVVQEHRENSNGKTLDQAIRDSSLVNAENVAQVEKLLTEIGDTASANHVIAALSGYYAENNAIKEPTLELRTNGGRPHDLGIGGGHFIVTENGLELLRSTDNRPLTGSDKTRVKTRDDEGIVSSMDEGSHITKLTFHIDHPVEGKQERSLEFGEGKDNAKNLLQLKAVLRYFNPENMKLVATYSTSGQNMERELVLHEANLDKRVGLGMRFDNRTAEANAAAYGVPQLFEVTGNASSNGLYYTNAENDKLGDKGVIQYAAIVDTSGGDYDNYVNERGDPLVDGQGLVAVRIENKEDFARLMERADGKSIVVWGASDVEFGDTTTDNFGGGYTDSFRISGRGGQTMTLTKGVRLDLNLASSGNIVKSIHRRRGALDQQIDDGARGLWGSIFQGEPAMATEERSVEVRGNTGTLEDAQRSKSKIEYNIDGDEEGIDGGYGIIL